MNSINILQVTLEKERIELSKQCVQGLYTTSLRIGEVI